MSMEDTQIVARLDVHEDGSVEFSRIRPVRVWRRNQLEHRPERRAMALDMRAKGATFREIGKALGVSASRAREIWGLASHVKAKRT